MQWAYDGQIRRYVTQVMRLLSNFPVKDSKGKLTTVPVMYGDMTRQVAGIIKQNSENKLPSAPRISVYITGLEPDRERTSDSSYTRAVNIRERAIDPNTGQYLNSQGSNYTVERLMPTPYILKINADIWTSNTDQKLQITEQLAIWFNPSLEIQTTDNFIDWTSLTVVNLESINWSNRSLPVGVDSEIDIGTFSFSIPIYISAPSKVKKMGIITNIITSIFNENTGTIETGVSTPEINAYDDYYKAGSINTEFGRIPATDSATQMANVNYNQFGLYIDGDVAKIVSRGKIGAKSWREILEAMPGNYVADYSKIYVTSLDNDSVFTGTIKLLTSNETELSISWDTDTFPQDSIISGPLGNRTTIDYIIDPSRFDPTSVKTPGLRFLILEDLGSDDNEQGPTAWVNGNGSNFVAKTNDIIEWDGSVWTVVFDAANTSAVTYVTNLNTNVQYKFVNGSWLLSVDGDYPVGTWRIDLYG